MSSPSSVPVLFHNGSSEAQRLKKKILCNTPLFYSLNCDKNVELYISLWGISVPECLAFIFMWCVCVRVFVNRVVRSQSDGQLLRLSHTGNFPQQVMHGATV